MSVMVAISVEERTGYDEGTGWTHFLNRLDKCLVVFNYFRNSCATLNIVYAQVDIDELWFTLLYLVEKVGVYETSAACLVDSLESDIVRVAR